MDPDQINELSGDPNAPLAFRMMEHIPGFTAAFLFAQHRGSNTLLRGGFMDDRRRGPGKLGGFTRSGELLQPTEKAYYGRRGFSTRGSSAMFGTGLNDPVVKGTRRATRLGQAAGTADGKMTIAKGFRVNHVTARPRALSRYNSLAMFNAAENSALYSPFQVLAKMGGKQALKNEAFKKAVYGAAGGPVEGEQVFQRGMLSMMVAGRKADILERKSIGGSARATRKVAKAQEQVKRLAVMNNPMRVVQGAYNAPGAITAATMSSMTPGARPGMTPVGMRGSALDRLNAVRQARAAIPGSIAANANAVASTSISYKGLGRTGVNNALAAGPQVGLTGNLMASAGATQASRFVQGYGRGALGMINAGGLNDDAMRGANRAVSHLAMALDTTGKAGLGIDEAGKLTGRFAEVYRGKAVQALEQGVVKTIGIKRTMQALGTKQGAMALGARAGLMAIPGLNVLATASLVYDLGKMGGELVKSGVNLAKDAVKSMKGSIDKPIFGMGYKDNEVAASSRARGVMAIQNSRLNARSMLGSEGAMMAAHFG